MGRCHRKIYKIGAGDALYVISAPTDYSSYRDFFRNPLYVGTVRLGPLTQQDETLRIIDDATWQACQARRLDPIPPRRVSAPYLLSGIIRCGRCGYVMWGREMKSTGSQS